MKDMRRTLRQGWMMVLILSLVLGFAGLGTAEETSARMTLERTPRAGDTEILLRWTGEGTEGLQANAFCGEQEVMESAVLEEELLTLKLKRPLEEKEKLKIFAAAGEAEAETLQITVRAAVNETLAAMEERLDSMIRLWNDQIGAQIREGKVNLPLKWREIPFVLEPGEAPEIQVTEEDETVTIHLNGSLPDGWKAALGAGLPVQMVDCIYDGDRGCWIGSGTFESIYLIREDAEDGISVSIEYPRIGNYPATYPTLQYVNPETNEAFGCYGWGDEETYQGGVYAMGTNGSSYYAFYGEDGMLGSYMDALTGCEYDAADQLTSGEESEGFVNPVIHEPMI